jgi:GNAT superfamily N-acetyltransferase
MDVEYRNMRREDEEAVFRLRMQTWGAPSIEYARQGAYLDPQYLDHTFVAMDREDNLLATVRYVPRNIRDARGIPRPVGCVASVVTIESARRQGHGRKLMQMAIESMRAEGFVWSFLLSSDMGVPLYESLGYIAPYAPFYQGILSGRRPAGVRNYQVDRIEPPFDFDDARWRVVRAIYATYNAGRPLSLVRDDAYWRGYFARRITSRVGSRTAALFLARAPGGEYVGYLYGDYSTREGAREALDGKADLDQHIVLGELGALPGHEAALTDLIFAFLEGSAQGRVAMSARVPRGGSLERDVLALYAPGMRVLEAKMMALPLAEGFGEEDIKVMFAAPGAVFWIADDF